jgi:hypothetical protein
VLIFYVLIFGVLYMALCGFAMDPTKEHQILCKSRKKCDRDPGNDQTNGRGRKRETYTESRNSPRLKQARQVKRKESMLITFFNIKGIVHKQFILANQTVNCAYYCDISRRLRLNVRRLHPELWRQMNWLLHHDNAPSHTSSFTREFLTKST